MIGVEVDILELELMRLKSGSKLCEIEEGKVIDIL